MLNPFFKKLSTQNLPPILLLLGDEDFLREKARQVLVDRFFQDASWKELNYAKFQCGEESLEKIINVCRDYPCFAEKRVVVLTQLEELKKKEAPILLAYLNQPSPSSFLLLEASSLDGRLDWVKTLKKQVELLSVPEATADDRLTWIKTCFKREAKQYESGVPELLLEYLGESYSLLQQSVAQLALYRDHDLIGIDDVYRIFERSAEENIFELVEAIFSTGPSNVLNILERLLASGEVPLKLLALLFRHCCILISFQESKGSAPQNLRIPWKAMEKYQKMSRKISALQIQKALSEIAQADKDIKSSPLSGELILRKTIFEIRKELFKNIPAH